MRACFVLAYFHMAELFEKNIKKYLPNLEIAFIILLAVT